MKRRGLLKLGVGAAVVLGVAGAGLALLKPGLGGDGKLGPDARLMMRAVALAALDGLWPADTAAREAALSQHLVQLDASIQAFPVALRSELSQVLSLLTSSGGRLALTGLSSDWSNASTGEVLATLNAMRISGSDTRQQVYRALRDLHCIVFFTEPAHWSLAGYPGPREIA